MKNFLLYLSFGLIINLSACSSQKKSVEKTSFDIYMSDTGPDKLHVVKVLKEQTGLSLAECKKLVDGVPQVIMKDLSKEKAEMISKEFIAVGAKTEVR